MGCVFVGSETNTFGKEACVFHSELGSLRSEVDDLGIKRGDFVSESGICGDFQKYVSARDDGS